MICQMLPLRPEVPRIDPDRIDHLQRRLGAATAEDVLCRALEEMAVRLSRAEREHRTGQRAKLLGSVRAIAAQADQIGLPGLARVADDVGQCLTNGDDPAVASTVARLVRVGEGSLMAIWDLDDLSL